MIKTIVFDFVMKIARKQTAWKKIALVGSAVVLVLVAAYGVGAKQLQLWPFSGPSKTFVNDPSGKVNYSPPTEQEIKNSQDAKKNSPEQEPSPKSSPSTNASKRPISVGISYAGINTEGKLEVRAFTPEIIEGSGTCTTTATNGSLTLTKSSPAFVDASSSICEPMYISSPDLRSGDWYVTVAYSSPDAQGTSDKVKVQ